MKKASKCQKSPSPWRWGWASPLCSLLFADQYREAVAIYFFFFAFNDAHPASTAVEITFKTFPFNVCHFPAVEVFSLSSGSWHARTPPGNIKSLRKSILALGAESRDGQSSGATLRRPEISSWCQNRVLADPERPSVVVFKGRFIQSRTMTMTRITSNIIVQYCWAARFRLVLWREEERTGVYPLFSFQTTKHRLDVSASSSSYYIISAGPPQPKEIGFCFVFSFHFMKFYLLFSFDHFMLWCLLCVESPFQLYDCGNLHCP